LPARQSTLQEEKSLWWQGYQADNKEIQKKKMD